MASENTLKGRVLSFDGGRRRLPGLIVPRPPQKRADRRQPARPAFPLPALPSRPVGESASGSTRESLPGVSSTSSWRTRQQVPERTERRKKTKPRREPITEFSCPAFLFSRREPARFSQNPAQ